ncbi:hypothetical protein bhYOR_001547 (plasmid) [Borrelia nietonii YOR]|nr:hypothetical protein [Borrelia nietonii]UPA10156.1 hypothetical protein bhYOR_001547 [Borrelia nietonii YOR]
MIKKTKTNEKIVEVGMEQPSLYDQKMFEGFDSFAHQSQDQIIRDKKV